MEMQELSVESKRNSEGEAGASELMLEIKTEEEAEPDHYAKLQSPSEDVYSETFYSGVRVAEKGKQTEGNERLYRAACLLLSVICLILLFVIITLSVKLQTGSPVCSEKEETTPADKQIPSPTCSPEQCQDLFPNIHSERISCQQCTKGWLTYGQSCYFLSTFRLPWAESQQNCTSRGGSLAVINSWNVQNFLTRKGNLKYWIGLRERDAAWNWVNNKKLRESYWAEHPNNGDCALLSTDDQPQKNWDRAPCQAATYFICQLQF